MWLTTLWLLAGLIAGETGTLCGPDAKLAVAHVAANRAAAGIEGGWYGWATPAADDLRIAADYRTHPDPTAGALFLLSASDLQLPAVQAFLRQRTRTARFECAGGTALEAWR